MREEYEKELKTEVLVNVYEKVTSLCEKEEMSINECLRQLINKGLEKACKATSLEDVTSKEVDKKRKLKTKGVDKKKKLKTIVSLKVYEKVISLCEKEKMSISECLRQLINKGLEKA